MIPDCKMLRLLRQTQPMTTRQRAIFTGVNASSTRRNPPSGAFMTLSNEYNHGKITPSHPHSSTLVAAATAAAPALAPSYRYYSPSMAAAASTNSFSWGGRSQTLSSSHFLYAQKRCYFYIPTSWTELKLRMLRDKGETKARMVKVKLHQFWNKHYGAAKTRAKNIKAAASVVAANRKQGREWLEKQQQQFLVLRNNFKGRRRRFYRKRFKEPLLQWVRPTGIISTTMNRSSSSSNSRHVDLALVGRRRGQWVVGSSLPESSSDSPSTTAAPHRFVVKVREYSEASWFDAASGRPLVSRDETGRFVNPWLSQSSDGVHPISSIIKWRQIRLAREWSAWQNDVMQRYIQPLLNFTSAWFSALPMQTIAATPGQGATAGGEPEHTTTLPKSCTTRQEEPEQLAEGTLRFTWIGHATCLLQQGDISILTDPIFSAHASPLPPLLAPFLGVARHVPPLRVSSQQQQRRHDMSDKDKENDDTDDDDDGGGKTVILPDKIDVCIISHDHYDHLDLPSVQQLADRVGCWVVPIGIGDFLQRHGCIPAHRIVELEWWESAKLVRKPFTMDNENSNDNNNNNDADPDGKCEHHLPDWRCVQIHSLHKRNVDNSVQEQEQASSPSFSMTSHQHHHHPARLDPANTNQLWITATPVQHWASRTMFDRNFRLWAGFCVFLDQQQTFFFAGDTAFPQEFPLFEQVADYIASAKINTTTTNSGHSNNGDQDYDDNDYDDDNKTIVDLAALPIGAYKPRFLNHTSHMEPKDALRVHEILQCRQSVAIHHGTFCLSEEPPDEPPRLLREAILMAAAAAQEQQQGISRRAAAALNFLAIPHGGRINLEPVSTPPIVDDDEVAVEDGRIVKDDKDSDENGVENDDHEDDDDSNNHAAASG